MADLVAIAQLRSHKGLSVYETAFILVLQVFMFISLAFAARVQEATELNTDDVKILTTANANQEKSKVVEIKYKRAKQKSATTDSTVCYINDPTQVALVEEYIVWRTLGGNELSSRFFMQINASDGSMKNQPFGKNTTAGFTQNLAQRIGKENHHAYTSHSARRTSITQLSENGIF